ncbi:HAD family hydrolase [Microbulbifer hydrolyticus]|uniref:phosphoserine phosphatase n=1 Tax=Microbulbifer hydrolyticus TaxID=48074 RepID=A0A6P1T7I5_9GAMM|nr:HAD family hydrolase [Microbulbifer hydrolyticus]MBB5210852.1 phosphoglycolate phosphatase-like HAD superfamily hydrolase [Microbulbifer hydrolyticus]QHQ38718.1 haloacid dehalogenase-like hydrolase [Microbulbifer hydrolyticus]
MAALVVLAIPATALADPLPSWNDGDTKKAITTFVESVTREGSPDFVAEGERIATFDNDGTLWAEQPVYFQLLYAIDQVKKMAPDHPEWKSQEPFASVIKGDMKSVIASGKQGLMKIIAATHANMTAEEFQANVASWLKTARHPKTDKPFNEMVYKPMLELMDYLRANGFKTFIVSGGGVDFMRVFAEETYGIPPDQVVGSSLKAKYEVHNGKPAIIKLPEINLIDDKEGKPVGIHQYIGQRPIFVAGNSDGDYQMLEWATSGDGPRFGLILHHTDAKREWAYDRKSHIGQLNKGLDDAKEKGWTVIDMQKDWKVVFPFDKQ